MVVTEKLPPQNIEAEAGVLGAILCAPDSINKVIEMLRPDYFYLESHQKLFRVMFDLFDKGRPVDLITVTEGLKARKELDVVQGGAYLSELTNMVSTSAHIMQHAQIVKEKFFLRSLIAAATQIVEESYDPSGDVDTVLDAAENRIFQISGQKVEGQVLCIKDLIKDSIETIDSLYQRKELVTGIPTGFFKLDEMTSGFHKADLVIVAGRPSMGKSALALSICEHVAVDNKIPVAYFSLEMSREQLVQRLLCSRARVNAQHVRTGFLSTKDWPKLTSAAGKLSEAPIYIDDSPSMTAFEIRAKARRLKSKHDIQLIVIDYLQLMHSGGRVENRQQEITEISRRLKALAREIKVPVIAVSQLSRAVVARQEKRPQLSDLRESGSIEQDADVVLLLIREEYYNPTPENKGKAEIIIAKQRNGPVGSIQLAFLKELTRFENLSMRDDDNEYNY
ncbi:MAG: replicative DNA helicase [Candidatus Omnitrophota bacterium]